MAEEELALLLNHFHLREEDCNQKISDEHLRDISSASYCSKWKELPSCLALETHYVDDIERDYPKEEEKRYRFLLGWRERKGFEATYKALIEALLKIKHRNDAEGVCELLKGASLSQDQPPPFTFSPQHSVSSVSSVTTSITSQQSLETSSLPSPTIKGMWTINNKENLVVVNTHICHGPQTIAVLAIPVAPPMY